MLEIIVFGTFGLPKIKKNIHLFNPNPYGGNISRYRLSETHCTVGGSEYDSNNSWSDQQEFFLLYRNVI